MEGKKPPPAFPGGKNFETSPEETGLFGRRHSGLLGFPFFGMKKKNKPLLKEEGNASNWQGNGRPRVGGGRKSGGEGRKKLLL